MLGNVATYILVLHQFYLESIKDLKQHEVIVTVDNSTWI
jgi:hypothetical protein